MLTEFSAWAKRARAQLQAPEVPMNAILSRANAARSRRKLRALILSCAITLTTAGTAAAFGTQIYHGVRLWLSGNKATVVIDSFAMVREPMAGDLQRVTADATFPVVLPVGMPAGMHLYRMMYAPAKHPSAIFLDYPHVEVAIFDSSTIGAGTPDVPAGTPQVHSKGGYRWQIGQETVLLGTHGITAAQAQRIRAAMSASTPAASLREVEPTLSRAVVLGAQPQLGQIARQYAPPNGRVVMMGPRFPEMIAQAAKAGKPLPDSRTVFATHIPSKNGEPDYAKATLQWPHTIAIPAGGVRALEAVLRNRHAGTDCRCYIFFNGLRAGAYRVWILRQGAAAPVKYAVDPQTFHVVRR